MAENKGPLFNKLERSKRRDGEFQRINHNFEK